MGKLTDKGFKSMLPLFVESETPPDHKCGSCFMRVPISGDTGACTVKSGSISMSMGVCLYWAKGSAAKPEDEHPMKMSDELSGYEEVAGVVQCGSCKFYTNGHCNLWKGDVKKAQCCVSWSQA